MAEAAKDPNGASDPGTTQKPKATLSQKAEELAARLEEHKLQAKAEAEAQAQADRKAAVKAAIKGEPVPSKPEAQKPAAQSAPAKPVPAKPAAAKPAPAKPAAAKSAPAKPAAAKPAAAKKPAPAKPAAAKSAPAKPAAAKPTPAKPAAAKPAPVEDVIRAIKLPHEIEAESAPAAKPAAAAAKSAPATTVQPKAPAEPVTQNAVPPVAVAPKDEPSASTAAAVAQARTRVFRNYGPDEEPSEAALKRRVARERALNTKPALGRTAQVIVAIIFPVLTLIAAIRLVATPGFLAMAYARPGFPADLFGFSSAERLTYGSYGVDYLNNFAGPEFLSGLVTPNGGSLFTSSEVQHMVDVKNLIGFAYVLGAILSLVFIICIWYLAKRYAGGVRRALFSGALVTLAAIAGLVVIALTGWERFFSGFHALFFSDGTWTFSLQDTLIRLYPEQFWVDSAATIAALIVLTVIIILISCWPTGRRREAARLRQEARAFGLKN